MNTQTSYPAAPREADNDLTDEVYRSPHPLAVVTLILGVVSILSLISSIFWLLPLVTVALGFTTLRSLAVQPEKIGRRAVVIGMFLAVLCGTVAWGYYFARETWITRVARRSADAWFALIQDQKLREAHQLHGKAEERAANDLALEDFYREQVAAESNFMEFFDAEPLRTIVRVADQARIEYERAERHVRTPRYEIVVLRYRVTYEEKGRTREFPVFIVMRRTPNTRTGEFDWNVESLHATIQGVAA